MVSNLITPHHSALEETELQIREGGRHPDPEIRGRGGGVWMRSQNFFFRPFGLQFGLKIKGGGGGGGSLDPSLLWCLITLLQSILK